MDLLIIYRIYRSSATTETDLMGYLDAVKLLGTPGIEFQVRHNSTLEVHGVLNELTCESGLAGTIRVRNVEHGAPCEPFSQVGMVIRSIWEFDLVDHETPFPQLLLWETLMVFAGFVDGWFSIQDVQRERFLLEAGVMIDFGKNGFVVDSERFLACALSKLMG